VAVAQQIQGDVQILKSGSPANSWQAITTDTPLDNGDTLKTSKGTFKLVYADEASFGVEQNTSLAVEQKPDAHNIQLLMGKIKGKVNKEKTSLPFQIATPAAVATVRGTEVDFGYNDLGELVIDLHNGKIEVINSDAEMTFNLEGKKSIWIQFNKELNTLRVRNECGSDGSVKLKILGAEYTEAPCDEKEISLSTDQPGSQTPPVSLITDPGENPNEGREPISPTENQL
jgi:hypothetical protein